MAISESITTSGTSTVVTPAGTVSEWSIEASVPFLGRIELQYRPPGFTTWQILSSDKRGVVSTPSSTVEYRFAAFGVDQSVDVYFGE